MLRQKLTKTKEFRFFVSAGRKFPFSALKLPFIRSLSVISPNPKNAYLDLGDFTCVDMMEACKSLNTLELHFQNAYAFLVGPVAQNKFESLTTLIIKHVVQAAPIFTSFKALPRNLTRFGLSTDNVMKTYQSLDINQFALLPRTLLHLTIDIKTITKPIDGAFPNENTKSLFPPSLVYLKLHGLLAHEALDFLPQTIEELDLETVNYGAQTTFKSSQVPKNLKSLKLADALSMEPEFPLPSSLTYLELGSKKGNLIQDLTRMISAGTAFQMGKREFEVLESSQMEKESLSRNGELIETIPNDMKNRPIIGLNLVLERNAFQKAVLSGSDILGSFVDFYCRVPSMETIWITDDELLVAVEKILKISKAKKMFLELQGMRLPSEIPATIEELHVCESMHPDDVDILPSSLKILSTSDSIYGIFATDRDHLDTFPQWEASHFAKLPKFITFMELNFVMAKNGDDLSNLKQLLFLETFILYAIPLRELKMAPHWLPKCLPTGLRNLHLDRSETDEVQEKPEVEALSANCLTDCQLVSVVPHLKMLKIFCTVDCGPNLGRFLSSLPRGLMELSVDRLSSNFEVPALSHLPKTLSKLSLYVSETGLGYITMSNDHLAALPRGLSSISFSCGPPCTMNGSVYQMLPKATKNINLKFPTPSTLSYSLSSRIPNDYPVTPAYGQSAAYGQPAGYPPPSPY